jgi:hypothetical protein
MPKRLPTVRIPLELYHKLEAEAAANHRSLNNEAVYRLYLTLEETK